MAPGATARGVIALRDIMYRFLEIVEKLRPVGPELALGKITEHVLLLCCTAGKILAEQHETFQNRAPETA